MNKVLLSALLAGTLAMTAPAMANEETATDNAVITSININHANRNQLAMLTGIGPAKAAAIVEYRETNGNFESVDDLAKVRGIGQATIDKNRHLLSN